MVSYIGEEYSVEDCIKLFNILNKLGIDIHKDSMSRDISFSFDLGNYCSIGLRVSNEMVDNDDIIDIHKKHIQHTIMRAALNSIIEESKGKGIIVTPEIDEELTLAVVHPKKYRDILIENSERITIPILRDRRPYRFKTSVNWKERMNKCLKK